MTDLSLDMMIKTWLRKDRERMKRLHGGKLKAPTKYSEEAWNAMKRYWKSTDSKHKSEKMSETRKKVVSNPWIGREGYAGRAAKIVTNSSTVVYFFQFTSNDLLTVCVHA